MFLLMVVERKPLFEYRYKLLCFTLFRRKVWVVCFGPFVSKLAVVSHWLDRQG